MTLQKLTCSNCNGSLRMNVDNRTQIYCPYCGQAFFVDDGKREYIITHNSNIVKTITNINHIIDDSKIIRAKNDRYKGVCIALLVVFVIIIGIFASIFASRELQSFNDSIDTGAIISAGSYSDYVDENFEAVVTQLESLGFTNVKTIDLDDSGLKFWTNEKVESVSISGKTRFASSDYFNPDAVVIVKYH